MVYSYYFVNDAKLSEEDTTIIQHMVNAIEIPELISYCNYVSKLLLDKNIINNLKTPKYKQIMAKFNALYKKYKTPTLNMPLSSLLTIHEKFGQNFIPYNLLVDKMLKEKRDNSHFNYKKTPDEDIIKFINALEEHEEYGKIICYIILFKHSIFEFIPRFSPVVLRLLILTFKILNINHYNINHHYVDIFTRLKKEIALSLVYYTMLDYTPNVMFYLYSINRKLFNIINEKYQNNTFLLDINNWLAYTWCNMGQKTYQPPITNILRENPAALTLVNSYDSVLAHLSEQLVATNDISLEDVTWLLSNLKFNNFHLWYMWYETEMSIELTQGLINYAKKNNTYKKDIKLPERFDRHDFVLVNGEWDNVSMQRDRFLRQYTLEELEKPIDYSTYQIYEKEELMPFDLRYKGYIISKYFSHYSNLSVKYFDIPLTCYVDDRLAEYCSIHQLIVFIKENLIKPKKNLTKHVLNKCIDCPDKEAVWTCLDLIEMPSYKNILETRSVDVEVLKWYSAKTNSVVSDPVNLLFGINFSLHDDKSKITMCEERYGWS
jgi:hypothetical protein